MEMKDERTSIHKKIINNLITLVCSILFYLNAGTAVSEKHIKSFYTVVLAKPNS